MAFMEETFAIIYHLCKIITETIGHLIIAHPMSAQGIKLLLFCNE